MQPDGAVALGTKVRPPYPKWNDTLYRLSMESHLGQPSPFFQWRRPIASSIWQEGQSKRPFPIFAFLPNFSSFSEFFPLFTKIVPVFFPIFPLFFQIFSSFYQNCPCFFPNFFPDFGKFFAVGGTLPTLTPRWLHHWPLFWKSSCDPAIIIFD